MSNELGFKGYKYHHDDGSTTDLCTEEQLFSVMKEANRLKREEHESAIWREFACAALNAIGDSWLSYADPAAHVADIADAMMKEARKRGKL